MRVDAIAWRCLFIALVVVTSISTPVRSTAAGNSDTVLYSFCNAGNCASGTYPGPPIIDGAGNLVGTAAYGANTQCAGGCGAAYLIAPNGTQTILHQFCSETDCKDGANPGGLIETSPGIFYGATGYGGKNRNAGTVFRLTLKGKETVIYAFCSRRNCKDGSLPVSLILGADGNFYGTTYAGGNTSVCSPGGCGTVFKLSPDGTETVLYSFCSQSNCADGMLPGGLLMGKDGNLYGETLYGGGTGCPEMTYGCGTLFKIAPDGTETVLHAFSGLGDGGLPDTLIADDSGNLYGETQLGGNSGCAGDGCGVVFQLTQDGTENVLYAFGGSTDGAYPGGSLGIDGAGNLYGSTGGGGTVHCKQGKTLETEGCGVVFELAPNGTETILYSFKGGEEDGAFPTGIVMDGSGTIYGSTVEGGGGTNCYYYKKRSGCGTIFKLNSQQMSSGSEWKLARTSCSVAADLGVAWRGSDGISLKARPCM